MGPKQGGLESHVDPSWAVLRLLCRVDHKARLYLARTREWLTDFSEMICKNYKEFPITLNAVENPIKRSPTRPHRMRSYLGGREERHAAAHSLPGESGKGL